MQVATNDIVFAACYGSSVYGTDNISSDIDMIVVIEQEPHVDHLIVNQYDITIMSKRGFREAVEACEVVPVECYFNQQYFGSKPDIEIDLQKLKSSFSKVASNSFVKAKKKFEVEGDFKSGRKSLFHSLRIPMFCIQIAKHGKITNFSEANTHWTEITAIEINEWSNFAHFKKKYNSIKSELRKVIPKQKVEKDMYTQESKLNELKEKAQAFDVKALANQGMAAVARIELGLRSAANNMLLKRAEAMEKSAKKNNAEPEE